MDDVNLKLLKDELAMQLDSYSINAVAKGNIDKRTPQEQENQVLKEFENILSAKNEWESCVDSLEHQAIVILDKNLKVIRTNKTIELWGWVDVKKARGIHILNLIKPAIEHDDENNWIDEWCQLDIQSNVEWVSNNYKTGKKYRFTFYPNSNVEGLQHNQDCHSVMMITDISGHKVLNAKESQITSTEEKPSDEDDSTDLIRLSVYRLHQLANRLISSQEDERKRVSNELHDGLGQILSALKYQVESAVIQSKNSSQLRKNDAVLAEILENVTIALSELRRVSVDLRPSILEDLGLLMTLKWFTNEYNKVYTDLNIHLHLEISELDISDKNKSVIYRIVQESMNNIAKHSNAKNIFINLSKIEKGILLRITDDGDGFDLKKVKESESSGLGLKSMKERAVKAGAKFTMSSSLSSSTVIKVFWPN